MVSQWFHRGFILVPVTWTPSPWQDGVANLSFGCSGSRLDPPFFSLLAHLPFHHGSIVVVLPELWGRGAKSLTRRKWHSHGQQFQQNALQIVTFHSPGPAKASRNLTWVSNFVVAPVWPCLAVDLHCWHQQAKPFCTRNTAAKCIVILPHYMPLVQQKQANPST